MGLERDVRVRPIVLQQNPIVVEVIRQPPITPEISYGSVLASAIGLVGVISLAAITVGLVIGGGIVWFKKRHPSASPSESTHVKLGI